MYEHRGQPMISGRQFAHRMLLHVAVATVVVAIALVIGAAGYHFSDGLAWIDATLEASMILGGMGPIHAPVSTAAKLFATGYALFSGLVFVALTALLLAPVIHRVLHRFKLGDDDQAS
jgi:hypothetical protein